MTSYTAATLELADRHIALGERHIVRQVQIIARLRALGGNVYEAERMLRLFHEMQQQHRAHRDAIAEALAQQDAESAREFQGPLWG